MLRTHCGGHKCFPVCPRGQHLLRTQNLCQRHKMFLISFRNILRPQQMFPGLLAQEKIMSNNVSSFATTYSEKERNSISNNFRETLLNSVKFVNYGPDKIFVVTNLRDLAITILLSCIRSAKYPILIFFLTRAKVPGLRKKAKKSNYVTFRNG